MLVALVVEVVRSDSVQFSCSVVSDLLWPHELQLTRPPCPSRTPRVHPNHVHWVSDAIQPSHPLSSPCPPAFNLCQHQGFFPMSQFFASGGQSIVVSALISVLPMNQLFTWGGQSTGVSALHIIPSKEIPGLISFRMDWLDLLAVQGTRKSLLQHHSSKPSILRRSAFFIV